MWATGSAFCLCMRASVYILRWSFHWPSIHLFTLNSDVLQDVPSHSHCGHDVYCTVMWIVVLRWVGISSVMSYTLKRKVTTNTIYYYHYIIIDCIVTDQSQTDFSHKIGHNVSAKKSLLYFNNFYYYFFKLWIAAIDGFIRYTHLAQR